MPIGEYVILKRQSNSTEAFQLLKKIGSLVTPIMINRKWKVAVLKEFFPKNPNLLGVNINKGLEIRIRLRPSNAKDTFLDLNDLVGTMLHELSHIVHGHHEAPFYKLLDELFTEWENGLFKGNVYNNSGIIEFQGNGYRVGGKSLDAHQGKLKAIESAEKRRKYNEIMTNGGTALGGNKDSKRLEKSLKPSEMAFRAAERRMKDDVWCGKEEQDHDSNDSSSLSIRSHKNSRNIINEDVIVISDDDDEPYVIL